MKSGITHDGTGGERFHIRDCYIWWAIHYLDSSTDYREYLPCGGANASTVITNDLVMLDSSEPSAHSYLWSILIVMLSVGLAVFAVYELVAC